jgi:type II secretory pathway pseudopilin PulG
MSPRPRRCSASAFSLTEAVIAVVILAVATPAMFWAIRDATERRTEPVLLERARWLAAERLEDVIADRFCPSRGYAFITAANYPAEASVAGFTGFSRQTTIAETNSSLITPGTGHKVVTVRVNYTGPRGVTRNFDLAAVVTDF